MLGMLVVWTLALLVACGVFVYASTVAGMESGHERRGIRGFFDDLRGGARGVRERRAARRAGEQEHEGDRPVAVDTPMVDFFAGAQEQGPAYMDATDVTESWARTGARAVDAARTARGHVRIATIRPRTGAQRAVSPASTDVATPVDPTADRTDRV